MKKHTFESVKKYFKDVGCELLQTDYKNVRTKLKFKCSCGEESTILFTNFKKGQRCAECGGTKKHTFEYVKKYFEDAGCELLESSYVNNKASMNYKCCCGNVAAITFDSFKRGARCMSCSGSEKYEFEYVKKYFSDNECELLEEEYKNARSSMKYVCKCENVSSTSFNHFRNGVRCMECSYEDKRHDFEDVKKYFLENGCELLETSYKGIHFKMSYRCKCKNTSTISFAHFKNGNSCMECANNSRKHSLEYVKEYFSENGCKLLETSYKGVNFKMSYICSCGEESATSFTCFQRGVRCRGCGYDKAAKSSYNFKDYICPDGTVVKYQGYENLALDELYTSYDQSDIENSRRNIPVINYEFEGKTCRYFPDIFIKSENKMIEVKSYYTYNLQIDKNIVKRDATKDAGFDYEVWIYVPKKKRDFDKHII